jgi:hypothetical protein
MQISWPVPSGLLEEGEIFQQPLYSWCRLLLITNNHPFLIFIKRNFARKPAQQVSNNRANAIMPA